MSTWQHYLNQYCDSNLYSSIEWTAYKQLNLHQLEIIFKKTQYMLDSSTSKSHSKLIILDAFFNYQLQTYSTELLDLFHQYFYAKPQHAQQAKQKLFPFIVAIQAYIATKKKNNVNCDMDINMSSLPTLKNNDYQVITPNIKDISVSKSAIKRDKRKDECKEEFPYSFKYNHCMKNSYDLSNQKTIVDLEILHNLTHAMNLEGIYHLTFFHSHITSCYSYI